MLGIDMNKVDASGEILKVYQTGDRPVLVLCSDGYHYIAKYKQPGYAANKLANELVGDTFAKVWGITTPASSLISNDPIIWDDKGLSHDPVAPLFGSRKMEGVFDLNEINCDSVKVSIITLRQFLKIALFDLWLANEDRTCNNYNLLYDTNGDNIVSIDYGGIFNSGILNNHIYQLNEADSIMSSDLFCRLRSDDINSIVSQMHISFLNIVGKCKRLQQDLLGEIPFEWGVDVSVINKKLEEVFDNTWVNDTWVNFKSIVNIV